PWRLRNTSPYNELVGVPLSSNSSGGWAARAGIGDMVMCTIAIRQRSDGNRSMIRAHWQDRIEVALGLWLVASPFVLGLDHVPTAGWVAMLAGVAVVTLAVDAFYYPEIVEEWGNLAVGIALAASPWLF